MAVTESLGNFGLSFWMQDDDLLMDSCFVGIQSGLHFHSR